MRATDRLGVAVVGLLLVAGGLLVLDLCLEVTGSYPDRVDPAPVARAVDAGWWPWASGTGGVVLVVLGLWWLLARIPRRGTTTIRLSGSGPEGRLVVDLGSVADAAAAQLMSLAPVASARGDVVRRRGTDVLELRVELAPGADLPSVTEAAAVVEADVHGAFPDDDVTVRVLVGAATPNRRRTRRRDTVLVREPEVSRAGAASPTGG
ncbi:hypothetical protein ABFT23_06830 [Nocardioides sp. C4-1]|uniref:hypothetical protein n=1 Tax=Nocardioides sp. C4-1 TaxID=3151851 RepID=UPI00326333AE